MLNMARIPFQQQDLTLIQTWTSYYIHYGVWDEINHSFQTSAVQPLKFGNVWINSFNTLPGTSLLIYDVLKFTHVSKTDP